LFFCIGTTFGAGDGNTTFNVPDLRGYFVRGSGTNDDGTAAGTFGTKQKSYGGNFTVTGTPGPGAALPGATIVLDYLQFNGGARLSDATAQTQTVEIPNGDHRPHNIALLYCIKF
jgi:microcystin-dependent protein